MNKLTVLVNEEVVFEFDRDMEFTDEQLGFLRGMDTDMDNGIKIDGELIVKPDSTQRATFVSMNLIKGLQQENEAIIQASCAYLVNRYPALIEVHVNDDGDAVKIELIEDKH